MGRQGGMRDGGSMAGRSQGRGQPFGRSKQEFGTEIVIVSALANSRLRAERLELDIAATLAKRALSCSISCALGVRIALDDFGTGILGSAIRSASRSRRSRLIVHPERDCR